MQQRCSRRRRAAHCSTGTARQRRGIPACSCSLWPLYPRTLICLRTFCSHGTYRSNRCHLRTSSVCRRADAEQRATNRALVLRRRHLLAAHWTTWCTWIAQWRARVERHVTRRRLRAQASIHRGWPLLFEFADFRNLILWQAWLERIFVDWRVYAARRRRCFELFRVGVRHRRLAVHTMQHMLARMLTHTHAHRSALVQRTWTSWVARQVGPQELNAQP